VNRFSSRQTPTYDRCHGKSVLLLSVARGISQAISSIHRSIGSKICNKDRCRFVWIDI
jgi:hypothetical protein